jgi:hypothetical protein
LAHFRLLAIEVAPAGTAVAQRYHVRDVSAVGIAVHDPKVARSTPLGAAEPEIFGEVLAAGLTPGTLTLFADLTRTPWEFFPLTKAVRYLA